MTNDPKILVIAFLGGIIPSLIWLWFWLKEDQKNPEPKGILAIVFILGMIGVVLAIQIQKLIRGSIDSAEWQLILNAGVEELIKYLAVMAILYKTNYADEPVDWPIYMITGALGFAALENVFFLIKPLSLGQSTISLFTGNFRFLGSTLLHTVSSGILGIALGLSMHMSQLKRKLYFLGGIMLAIALHTGFNFFIMRINVSSVNYILEILKVCSFLWVVTIIVMLLFEKVRRIN